MTCLQMIDAALLKDFVREKVVQSLLDRQRVLIVVTDDDQLNSPAGLLSAINLSHLCLPLSMGVLSDSRIAHIRSLSTLVSSGNSTQSLSLNRANTLITLQKIKEVLAGKFASDDINPALIDLVSYDNTISLHKIVGPSLTALMADIDSIDELENCYDPGFRFIDSALKLKPTAFETIDQTHNVLLQVKQFKRLFEAQATELSEALLIKKKDLKRQIIKECQEWKNTLNDIIYHQKAYQLGDKSSFVSVIGELLHRHDNFTYVKPQILLNNALGWSQVNDIVDKIKFIIHDPSSRIEEEYQKFYHRLTPYNIVSLGINDTVQKSIQLIVELNDSQLFKNTLPTKFFQIFDLEAKIAEAIEWCSLSELALSNKEYCRFRVLCQHLNINQQIIEYLCKNKQQSWRETIVRNTTDAILENEFPTQLHQLKSLFKEYQNILDSNKELALLEVHNRWCHQRDLFLSILKNDNWDLYQELFVGQDRPIHILELVADEPEFMSVLYPIWVVTEPNIALLQNHFNLFDQILMLNTEDWSKALEASLVDVEANITIATIHEVNNLPANTRIINSNEIKPEAIRPYNELNRTERYKQGLSFASFMIDIIDSFTVYQWRNVCIISLMDKRFNTAFLQKFENQGLNSLYLNSFEIADLLEGMIIEDTEIVMLLPEGLLNVKNIAHLEFQLHLIRNCQAANFKLIDVNLDKIHYNGESLLEQIAEEVRKHMMSVEKTSKSNQNGDYKITPRTIELEL